MTLPTIRLPDPPPPAGNYQPVTIRNGLGSYEFGDSDADGVLDNDDMCPGTAIPEAAPTRRFGKNRWALTDGTDFEQAPPQAGSKRSFSTADTGGCSCEQIVAAAGIGGGHLKFGCSTSVMLAWVELVNS